jgi:histidine triad (HIT) family protein
MSCVFCRIIAGEVESSKVYEDEHILAFLDLYPVRDGQLIVIPKKHIDHFSDIPDELAVRIFLKSHQISRVIKEKLHPERMGLVVHGYGVSHAHMVLVPQHHEDDITTAKMAKIEDGRIIFTADNLPASSRDELNMIAKIIKDGLLG